MPDLLVKLYDLPPVAPLAERLKASGVDIRRAIPVERYLVVDWVRETFGDGWASECDIAFSRQPISCFIAVESGTVVGFGCYDACYKNFFGPEGVDESVRGRGIGKALVLACLHAMAAEGYGYGIIGWAAPVEFYKKTVKAIVIDGSEPGIYRGLLKAAHPPANLSASRRDPAS